MEKYSSESCAASLHNSLQRNLRRIRLGLFALGLIVYSLAATSHGAPSDQDSLSQSDTTTARVARIIHRQVYDGVTDDLLTAGLGIAGLATSPIALDDPLQPSWATLRRRAIQQNYRGLIDLRPQNGFGSTYGPIGDVRIPGTEILAALPDPSGHGEFTAWLQIPSSFKTESACLVVIASSGSRGIFGALPTAGEWPLQQGCAVVHTDKGTGSGIYALGRSTSLSVDGQLIRSSSAQPASFHPEYRPEDFAGTTWLAFKHAHSGHNPEFYWGDHVLLAGRWALATLSKELDHAPLSPANTLIVAAGISNGGGAVLRAIELDQDEFFDGVVAAEPNIANPRGTSVRLKIGNESPLDINPLGLYEWSAQHALLQPCAVLGEDLAAIPLGPMLAFQSAELAKWCENLAASGELVSPEPSVASPSTTPVLARRARERLLALGVEPGALRLGAINIQFDLWRAVLATYASALSGSHPSHHPCQIGFSALDAQRQPRMFSDAELITAFADSSGIAPTAGIELVIKDAEGNISAAPNQRFNSTLCLKNLIDTLQPAIDRMAMQGYHGARPVLVLHGREDGLVSVTHTSRAYMARSSGTGLRYYELRGVQHFDAFLPVPGMNFKPMQPALNAAMSALFDHLREGAALPPSQVTSETLGNAPKDVIIRQADGTVVIPE